jgi:hypothetical protein
MRRQAALSDTVMTRDDFDDPKEKFEPLATDPVGKEKTGFELSKQCATMKVTV